MAKQNGDFDDDEGFFESLMRRKDAVPMPESMAKLFKIIAGGAVLLIVGLVAWAVWPSKDSADGSDVPVVHAETEDYKVKPDEPGGMPIPNKDSTVFESMDTAPQGEKNVENLLEDSEQPMKKEEVFTAASAAVEETPAPAEVASAKEEVPAAPSSETLESAKEEAPKEPVKEAVKEAPKVEKKAEKTVEKKADKKEGIIQTLKEETGTTEKPKAKSSGSVYIQLAAVKSDAEAKTKWSKLQSSYASLKPLSLRVQKADLGDKGTFYRVQGGPLSAEDAATVCGKIKAAGGACIIAK